MLGLFFRSRVDGLRFSTPSDAAAYEAVTFFPLPISVLEFNEAGGSLPVRASFGDVCAEESLVACRFELGDVPQYAAMLCLEEDSSVPNGFEDCRCSSGS